MRTLTRSLSILLLVTTPGACQESAPATARVREAVRTAASGALAAPVTAGDPRVAVPEAAPARDGSAVDTLPQVRNEGASVTFVPDASHREIAALRTAAGWAVAWTDDAHDGLWFGRADGTGTAQGRGVRVHAATEGEERVATPAVIAAGEGYAVAWVDGENGRVLFARLDAAGRAAGAPSIVHEGLEHPRSVSLATSGRDFAVGVGLWRGVYFARLDASGARVGDGAMLSEGEAVTAIEGVRWERGGYTVAWTEPGAGRVERRLESHAAGRAAVVGALAPRRRVM